MSPCSFLSLHPHLPFCVWVLRRSSCSAMQASCCLCLNSSTQGWKFLELEEGNSWISTSSPELLFSSKRILPSGSDQNFSPEVQDPDRAFCLIPSSQYPELWYFMLDAAQPAPCFHNPKKIFICKYNRPCTHIDYPCQQCTSETSWIDLYHTTTLACLTIHHFLTLLLIILSFHCHS